MTSPFDLTSRVALVTGAGRGIGREIARTLARAGADIVAVGLPGDALGETVADVHDLGRHGIVIEADVADPRQVDAAVARALADLGAIHVLVNCAGIARNSPAETTTDEDWARVIEVNLFGTLNRTGFRGGSSGWVSGGLARL